jgi:hypothetical protein
MAFGPVFTRESLPDEGKFSEYQKTQPTKAMRVKGPFQVATREGIVSCSDGWLAIDSDGWPYPIEAQEFARVYEPTAWQSSDAPA